MNKITFEELKKITSVCEMNMVDENSVFDYFRIVSISKIKYEEQANNPLFFITYITDEEDRDGWYINKIDLRENMHNFMKEHPNYTYVVDKTMRDKLNNCDNKYIMVEDINATINELFSYFKDKSHAKTIAITGSVGKTTCVGLIESVVKQKYKIWRIYSKRITPLILKANIINHLNDDIDYIVLENSIYYHDHVKILAGLLKPEITAILNIESSHLGIEELKTIDDICKYKAFIMQYAKKCFLIKEDPYLDKLHLDSGNLKYNNDFILKNNNLNLERIDLSKIVVQENSFNIENEVIIEPFMLSNLSKKQYAVAYKIGKELGITNEQIKKGMEEYVPVENRVLKEKAFGKTIIFDGDVTTYERMRELSDNMYSKKYLVLRKVGSAENTLRIADIKEFFKKYANVFIFDDVEYLDELKDEDNVLIVSNHDFMSKLDGMIIYHYSGYYRVWDKFNEENLNIYDTVKYPIIKENEMKKKILLLHGWNWKNYTKLTNSKDAWENRKIFVDKLMEKYDVYKLNFPGFCGEKEKDEAYDLEDYAKFVKDYLDKNNLNVDYLLGYSFGGAVALMYHLLYNQNQKIILISPAITRNKNNSKKMIKTPKFMQKLREKIRDYYLIHVVKNPYMVNGTRFLNASYQKIVRKELLNELEKVNPKMIQIIYGKLDEQVNPNYIINNVSNSIKKRISIIEGGMHDIANTHADEIIRIIDMF